MHQIVRKKKEISEAVVECVYNRDLEEKITTDQIFFYLSPVVHDHFGVDQTYGEILLFSPNFRKDLGSPWVGIATDFESVG